MGKQSLERYDRDLLPEFSCKYRFLLNFSVSFLYIEKKSFL